ncbi:MAG: helix-turn-helix transcriptional regulator [Synergistaceae bacterium]|nr:helix-turn-helix transcriptional regulator [Synergistaceae bacterium]
MFQGSKLREQRELLKVSQEALADKVNVHVNTIRRWEQDKQTPDAKKLALLADALSTSVAHLSGETDGSVLQEKIHDGEDTKGRLIINNSDLHINMPDRPESFTIIQRFFDWQLAKQQKNCSTCNVIKI